MALVDGRGCVCCGGTIVAPTKQTVCNGERVSLHVVHLPQILKFSTDFPTVLSKERLSAAVLNFRDGKEQKITIKDTGYASEFVDQCAARADSRQPALIGLISDELLVERNSDQFER